MRKIISAVHRVSPSRSFEVIRGHQHTNQACGHQRSSAHQSSMWRVSLRSTVSSEVIRGHQRSLEVIRGH
jgi:hypothetical protein